MSGSCRWVGLRRVRQQHSINADERPTNAAGCHSPLPEFSDSRGPSNPANRTAFRALLREGNDALTARRECAAARSERALALRELRAADASVKCYVNARCAQPN